MVASAPADPAAREPRSAPGASIRAGVLSVLASLVAVSAAGADELLSDRVTVLETDGRSTLVQHTLATAATLVTLDLPGSVIPQRVRFAGPERALFERTHERQPGRIAIWSGSAFARWRHQYGDALTERDDGARQLTLPSVPPSLRIDSSDPDGRPTRVDIAQTWVFPGHVEVLDWYADNPSAGEWTFEANTLLWRQRDRDSVTLTIVWRHDASNSPGPEITATIDETRRAAPVPAADPPPDTDRDDDGVADASDICPGDVRRAGTDAGGRAPLSPQDAQLSLPGCNGATAVVLDAVSFATGRTRLDLDARRALDRVASALQRRADTVFEIGAHTDGNGTSANNEALSARRARSVRQYLLLRGVPPAQLVARGYGESAPIADDATAEGRRLNRRVELRALGDQDSGR